MHYAAAAFLTPTQRSSVNSRQVLQLFILAAIWGASFLFIRLAVPNFGPVPLSAIRSTVAALVLTPIVLARGELPVFKRYWPHLFVIGLISTALPFALFALATEYTSAGFASILNSLTPIFSALVAWLWLKEQLTPAMVIGILLGFAGVLVMVLDRDTISSGFVLLPVLAGLAGSLLYGMTGNYSRRFAAGVPVSVIAAGSQVFSMLTLLPLALWQWPAAPIPASGWGYALVLGVLCTAVAHLMYFNLLGKVGVARTVVVTYLIPVFAMLWGFLILGEGVTLKMLAGAACILSGIGLTTYKARKNAAVITAAANQEKAQP
jgi:drug/metabolite transporter (DMT)-like permease